MVGAVLRSSPLAADTPWHRVINASGRISDRDGRGAAQQRRLLESEGVTFDTSGRVDLAVHLWGFAEAGAG
jgi:methylated-DNA-protein-cysteine methyltransferase-like protein